MIAVNPSAIAAPADTGKFNIIWDDGADGAGSDDLVTGDAFPDVVPPEPHRGRADVGPCTAWMEKTLVGLA